MARVGSIPCPAPGCTNADGTVSESPATGTLNVGCHRCQFSGFAKKGTKAHRFIAAAMTPDEPAAAKPGTKAAPAAPPAPLPPIVKQSNALLIG